MKNRIIAAILTFSLLFSLAVPVCAVEEQFLSEVALIYRDSAEDARKAIEGTDWKLFEKDLNADADYMIDDGVYLIYKTSTNVDDAITDLRVMDMYGGFSVSNYYIQLDSSRSEYLAMISDIRKVAKEWKELYLAGDEMAKLAYRQMNYYKDIKTEGGSETDLLMGDFMLNLPSDGQMVQVLMEGNSNVVSNLITLLAIGISGANEDSLANKIAAQYEIRDTLTPELYHERASSLETQFQTIAAKIARFDALSEEFDLDDQDIPEDEFQFVIQIASLVGLLDEIMLGDQSLTDLLRTDTWTLTDLYPIVSAFTEAQAILVKLGQLETVLKYSVPTKPIEELTAIVEYNEASIIEKEGSLQPIDVYIGVDRSIFKGSFAMTNSAQRQQALTGETWDMSSARTESETFYAVSVGLAVLDMIVWGIFADTIISEAQTMPFYYLGKNITYGFVDTSAYFRWNAAGVYFWGAIGMALISAGLAGFSTWYNYYNPDYTEIPNTIIDVRETDLGDKYIKYSAAKVFGEKDDKNADFNAYQGKEWNALYYTKDPTAGYSLTPNFVYRENNSTVSRRHQGVSMFGETEAFDLNSHVYNEDANGIYLSVRYSMTKKTGADLPQVVGSLFSNGAYYALTALAGICVGAGAVSLLHISRKKKEH